MKLNVRSLLVSPTLALSLASLFWSGNFIVGRALRDEIQALPLNYWRWLIALVIIAPPGYRLLKQHSGAVTQHWKFVILLAITGIVGFHICVYKALQTTTAINALLFLSVSPVMIIIGSRFAFRDYINAWQAVGITISLAGVLVILTHGEPRLLGSLTFNIGDIWMLVAVLLWSAYSVILKRKPESLPQMVLLSSTVTAGVIIMTPFYLSLATDSAVFQITLPNIGGLLYISVFASVLAYYFWNYGVSKLGPNTAGSFLHLMPLFGAILSVVFLDEDIQFYHLLGAVFIAAGITLSSQYKTREPG